MGILKKRHNVLCLNFKQLLENGFFAKGTNQLDELISIVQYILSLDPDIIGFSSVASDFYVHLYISKKIRSISKKVKIVFGGPEPSAVAHEAISKFPWVDSIAIGESEHNILQLVECLIYEKGYEDVPGVVFQGQPNEGKSYQFIKNMDDLDLVYYDTNFEIEKVGTEFLFPIETGRGCPFRCIYCWSSTLPEIKYRRKSNKRILNEIVLLHTNHGIKAFDFTHDLFTHNKDIILELCSMFRERDLKISWSAHSRIDTIDEILLRVMIDSGCKSLFFGIESGSERIQVLINKKMSIKTVYENIDMISKVGLPNPIFSFIYGFPQETDHDLEETMNMISYLIQKGYSSIIMHRLSIFNSTKLYNLCKSNIKYGMPIDLSLTTAPFDSYMECTKEIYEGNEMIFPYLFHLDTHSLNNYPSLANFINHWVCLYAKNHRLSSRLLFFNGSALLRSYNFFVDYIDVHSLSMQDATLENLEDVFVFIAKCVCDEETYDAFQAMHKFEKGLILIRQNKVETFSFRTKYNLLKTMKELLAYPRNKTHFLLGSVATATLTLSKGKIVISYKISG